MILQVSNLPPKRRVERNRTGIEEQKLNLTRVSDSGGIRSALNPQINRLSQNGFRAAQTINKI